MLSTLSCAYSATAPSPTGPSASLTASGSGEVKAKFAGRSNVSFYTYPKAGHGFNCWDRASYHPHSAALAHGRTLVFLGENA